jgi:hypothetical protein
MHKRSENRQKAAVAKGQKRTCRTVDITAYEHERGKGKRWDEAKKQNKRWRESREKKRRSASILGLAQRLILRIQESGVFGLITRELNP